ncbi:hypothetical protein B0H65DRAFT_42465 [Neurospora tetraspora]|uniref:Uncharacterized protein n=1 Tax=Neurospora tetraspora TaxID=94610 RepID=A0AAE0JPV4_9PEZI|nr:hypothetical protein B0H65DRAFT_42465 [Neurospora tetraspora]
MSTDQHQHTLRFIHCSILQTSFADLVAAVRIVKYIQSLCPFLPRGTTARDYDFTYHLKMSRNVGVIDSDSIEEVFKVRLVGFLSSSSWKISEGAQTHWFRSTHQKPSQPTATERRKCLGTRRFGVKFQITHTSVTTGILAHVSRYEKHVLSPSTVLIVATGLSDPHSLPSIHSSITKCRVLINPRNHFPMSQTRLVDSDPCFRSPMSLFEDDFLHHHVFQPSTRGNSSSSLRRGIACALIMTADLMRHLKGLKSPKWNGNLPQTTTPTREPYRSTRISFITAMTTKSYPSQVKNI